MNEKTENAVAVRTEMTKYMEAIENALKSLKVESEQPYKTNGEFRFAPAFSGNVINIHKSTDVAQLLGILGQVSAHKDNYDKAAKITGVEFYPEFQWLGHTADAWQHDVKVRVLQLTQKEKLDKLRKAKSVLEGFMTEEDRIKQALKNLKDLGLSLD